MRGVYIPAILLLAALGAARAQERSVRILALGDSYTIGQGVEPRERWPVQLAARLGAPEPTIIARTGWTTDELSRAIDAADPRGPFDLVTLLIGVNDQYRGRSLDDTRPRFVALLERAIAFAGGDATKVLVLSVPDWGVTPFARGEDRARIARELDALNAMERAETERLGARWLDITDLTRATPLELAADGLHPSGAMYARWAERAEPLAREALAGE